jgi:DNA repair protein RAD5
VKGKGYVNSGDGILVERDPQGGKHGFHGSTAREKLKNRSGKDKDGTKQLKLTSMIKSQPSNLQTKHVDTIVRLANLRGFGVSETLSSVWLQLTIWPVRVWAYTHRGVIVAVDTVGYEFVRRLELGWLLSIFCSDMVEFRGSTMIDCPTVLHSGADLIVSLGVFIRPVAFKPPSTSAAGENQNPVFGEGQETQDEKALRERKSALLRLFDAVGLRPSRGAGFTKSYERDVSEESLKKLRTGTKSLHKEIVGDGEEIEVEDGEDLSENELNTIYKRSGHQRFVARSPRY